MNALMIPHTILGVLAASCHDVNLDYMMSSLQISQFGQEEEYVTRMATAAKSVCVAEFV